MNNKIIDFLNNKALNKLQDIITWTTLKVIAYEIEQGKLIALINKNNSFFIIAYDSFNDIESILDIHFNHIVNIDIAIEVCCFNKITKEIIDFYEMLDIKNIKIEELRKIGV